MLSNRSFLMVFGLLCSMPVVSSYYGPYFSDSEVFSIVERQNNHNFDRWLSTYPNVNIFNSYGQTPLMIAAKKQNRYFTQRLLDAGAYRYYVDCFGKTARDYALESEYSYCAPSVVDAVIAGAAVGACAYVLYKLATSDAVEISVSNDLKCPNCHYYSCHCYPSYPKVVHHYHSQPSYRPVTPSYVSTTPKISDML